MERKKKRLLILGAGGHGNVVKEVAESCGYETSFLDDSNPIAVGSIRDLVQVCPAFDECVVAIGNADIRSDLMNRLEQLHCMTPVLIHPTAYVSPSATIGTGTVVAPHATIHTNVIIGKGSIVSINAVIDHDVKIGDYCHINAGAICMAGTHLENGAKLDAGEIMKNQTENGEVKLCMRNM